MRSVRTGIGITLFLLVLPAVRPPSAAGAAAATGGAEPLTYRPPADAPVVDTFRPPATPYGAGNRGIDYGTTPGQPVHAAAPGTVVFAGPIAGRQHVVLLHADGIRTSYSFLATTVARRGEHVDAGDPVGTAAADQPLHFGARAPGDDHYLDPLVLLGQVDPAPHERRRVRLVDDPHPERPLSESVERRKLVDSLRGLLVHTGEWLEGRVRSELELARAIADTAADLGTPLPVLLSTAALEWQAQQDPARCTDAATTPPPEHPARDARPPRIAVLVGGLGSATGHTAVLDVDTRALGYVPSDVHQFSYVDDPSQPYTPADTLGDIGEQSARLARLIETLQRQHPGSPIDVIAHSQGGLVARSALTTHHATPATLVTLGTPHQGTDLATAATTFGATSDAGHATLTLAGQIATSAGLTGIDPNATSIQQMGETSEFLRTLPEVGWDTDTTFVTSIAARGDPVVPNRHSHLQEPPAHNVVVSANQTSGLGDHVHLPGSPEATAEIARAIARQPPTCRSLRDALVDAATSWSRSNTVDLAAAALSVAGMAADVSNVPRRP